ncbi:hypothetical protein V8C35DRAFT_297234 [Trichoderma chlorosporum]
MNMVRLWFPAHTKHMHSYPISMSSAAVRNKGPRQFLNDARTPTPIGPHDSISISHIQPQKRRMHSNHRLPPSIVAYRLELSHKYLRAMNSQMSAHNIG